MTRLKISLLTLILIFSTLRVSISYSDELTAISIHEDWPPASELIMDCFEMVAFFFIDPIVARQHVPEEYNLIIMPAGVNPNPFPADAALLAVIVQNCDNLILNGAYLDPDKLSHAWILLDGGTPSFDPAPGGEYIYNWYSVMEQNTSQEIMAAGTRVGMDNRLVKEIFLPELIQLGDECSGWVIEHGGPISETQVGYCWDEHSFATPPLPFRVIHNVFRKSGNKGRVGKLYIECDVERYGLGEVSLEVNSKSELGSFSPQFESLPDTSPMIGGTWDNNISCDVYLDRF